MADKGWIKLYRKVRDNWIWDNPEYFRAWIDILLMANHEDRDVVFNGHVIKIKKGQKLTSLAKLSERWRWSRNRVDRYLRLLSDAGMVTANRTPNGTLLTVEKYGFYQTSWDSDEATDEATHGATHGAADGAQTRIKELKNEEEVKRGRDRPRFVPPTLDDVSDYFWKIGCDSDPQLFIDYYEARGWRLSKGMVMADWKAAARSWKKRGNEKENRWGNDPDQRNEYGGEIDWGL